MKPLSRRRFLSGAGVLLASLSARKGVAETSGANSIVRAAIHPGIGFARIGNSTAEDGYFIGPEIIDPPLTNAGVTRDYSGAIKRQAARFRIFGYNAAGKVVAEITADIADIQWQVHVANKKAGWYRSVAALDLPEATELTIPRRNPKVTGAAAAGLVIDPGQKNIGGKNISGPGFHLDGGHFMNTPVSLGEVRTDGKGRLLVFGGQGKSASPRNTSIFDPNDDDSFNNAAGWYDDISDGPVHASVTMNGQQIPVDSAWVIVAPPNYAPDLIGWRTMYDMLHDLYIENGLMPAPQVTSFTNDVLPVLRRLSRLQWVNKGFSDLFGKGSPADFDDPALIAQLANVNNADLRKSVYESFRVPGRETEPGHLWPLLYGDAYGSFSHSPSLNLVVSEVTDSHLQRWVQGTYTNDWNPNAAKPYRRLSDVPLSDQPAMLDKAALHFCLADAFHPGCELTWPMRHITMYRAPFRIRERAENDALPDYGDHLTSATALQKNGPLYGQAAGDLTKWMALPWQGDTVFCRSGYEPKFDPYLPTFWPARVPNHILSEADYLKVMDITLPRADRLAAFKNRENWVRAMTGEAPEQMLQMVSAFGRMGIVEARPGINGDPDFPAVMMVESLAADHAKSLAQSLLNRFANRLRADADSELEKAGWESREQLDQFRKIMKLK